NDADEGSRGSRLTMVFAMVLAIVLVGGVGFGGWYFFVREDEHGAADRQPKRPDPYREDGKPTGTIGWDIPGTNDDLTLNNSWVTDHTVVLATDDTITGYDRLDGTEKWSLTPPELESWPKHTENPQFCGGSRDHRDGLVAVTYGWAE